MKRNLVNALLVWGGIFFMAGVIVMGLLMPAWLLCVAALIVLGLLLSGRVF